MYMLMCRWQSATVTVASAVVWYGTIPGKSFSICIRGDERGGDDTDKLAVLLTSWLTLVTLLYKLTLNRLAQDH